MKAAAKGIEDEKASRPAKIRIECNDCRANAFILETTVNFEQAGDSREHVAVSYRYKCRGCGRLYGDAEVKSLSERVV